MTPLELALNYIARGWNPTDVPHKAKRPQGNAWQKRIIDAASAAKFFNGGPQNIGIVLGPTSHGLTDVDLDCPEALAIAPYVLPQTKARFGRPSKRESHRLYYTDLAVETDAATIQYKDPKTKGMILELRIGGDSGAQTIFPGSTHESGEAISWEEDGEPATVDSDDLRSRVRAVAAYSLLARYWPGKGSRHAAALTIGGFLSRAGKAPTEIKTITEAIAHAANDEEWRDRRAAAGDAATAHRNGKNAHGFNVLRETVGQDIAAKVAVWLDYTGDDRSELSAETRAGKSEKIIEERPSRVELKSMRASQVELEAIEWLWLNRFALGKLGLLVGLPDEGKGQILCYMAAQITRGLEWPCGEGRALQGNVILLTAEDDPADTVVPRLVAAGADLDCVEIVSMVRESNKERMFSLVTDLELLRRKIVEVGNVRQVQIDPISAYLGVGKVDSFRTPDVRAVLAPLVDLATEFRVSIIGIMHFNKKNDVTNALLRISDSLAFSATARHVYAVINDAENKRKLFVKGKNNLAPDTQALAYGFGVREVGHDRKTGKLIQAPYILWHPQHVDVSATEAMQAATENKSPAARDGAKRFLTDLLSAGKVPKLEIEEAARANCISDATLRRAKDDLGIVARKDAPNGGWTWQLPEKRPKWHD